MFLYIAGPRPKEAKEAKVFDEELLEKAWADCHGQKKSHANGYCGGGYYNVGRCSSCGDQGRSQDVVNASRG